MRWKITGWNEWSRGNLEISKYKRGDCSLVFLSNKILYVCRSYSQLIFWHWQDSVVTNMTFHIGLAFPKEDKNSDNNLSERKRIWLLFLSFQEAQTLSQALKNTYLPEKISESDKGFYLIVFITTSCFSEPRMTRAWKRVGPCEVTPSDFAS